MGSHWKLLCIATGLWTLSATMAIGGTLRQEVFLLLWGLLVAVLAGIATVGLVAICAATTAARQERISMERLAEIMASTAADPGVSRLPR